MNIKTDIDGLSLVISKLMDEFSDEIKETARETIDEVSNEAVQAVKDAAPVKTGKYKKSIKDKVTVDTALEYERTIYAANGEHRKTHLLENGHAIAGGTGRTKPQPHWSKGQEYIEKNFEKKLKERIEK